MTILLYLLLGLASLLTLPVALLVIDARHAAGANAMGLVMVPMLLAPRWLALAGAVAIACSRSALGWIHPARAWQAVVAAEHERRLAAQHRALRALSPQAPLREWSPWLNVSIDELRDPALAAVRARPTLVQDVAAMLRAPDEAPVALRFLWLWMPDPPASLAGPIHEAIAGLPAWAERHITARADATPAASDGETEARDDRLPERPVELSDMAQAAIVLADTYAQSGFDFVTPIRAFDDVLTRHALPEEQLGSDITYQPRSYLETWLQRADATRARPSPAPAR